MKRIFLWVFAFSTFSVFAQSKAVVFQTDFGLKDGAVAAMKGVVYGISPDIELFDLTHEIPAYNIWEAAYRLNQTAPYWPAGTVFVSVVDPGVGSSRRSVVMRTKTGHYFVTPDNGTLTLVAESMGVDEVRIIDEEKNRRKNSTQSYTFHGRDVYAFTAARLAAGIILFRGVGDSVVKEIVKIDYQKPEKTGNKIKGTIDILDVQYGNLWTNISKKMIDDLKIVYGDKIDVKISNGSKQIYQGEVVFGRTFSDVAVGKPVAYINSLLNFAVGLNQDTFAGKFKIESGPGWTIELIRK